MARLAPRMRPSAERSIVTAGALSMIAWSSAAVAARHLPLAPIGDVAQLEHDPTDSPHIERGPTPQLDEPVAGGRVPDPQLDRRPDRLVPHRDQCRRRRRDVIGMDQLDAGAAGDLGQLPAQLLTGGVVRPDDVRVAVDDDDDVGQRVEQRRGVDHRRRARRPPARSCHDRSASIRPD